MSLVKQLESYIFPENFGNKSIVNIILDYSKNYRFVFNKVLKGLKRDIVLMDNENDLNIVNCNTDEKNHYAYSTTSFIFWECN